MRGHLTAAAMACVVLMHAACTQTSRVDDTVTTQSLARTQKGVAVMRLGAATGACQNVAVMLGVREGEGFRRHQNVVVTDIRSLKKAPVAEVELDPGEYHIVAYGCTTGRGNLRMIEDSDGQGLLRRSFASFTLGPGEIVNVGYFHINASRVGRNMFGRPVRTAVTITDWPLAELDRFKAERPQIYAQMTTRLMVPTGIEQEDCGRLQALKAEGKIQNVPAACAEGAATAPPAAKTVRR